MFLPRKILLGCDIVFLVASDAGGQPLQTKALAERLNVPKRYLEPILQQLGRSGILHSGRGPKGGYTLEVSRATLTLADIVNSTSQLTLADDDIQAQPVVADNLSKGSDAMLKVLATISLQDLCNQQFKAESKPDAPTWDVVL